MNVTVDQLQAYTGCNCLDIRYKLNTVDLLSFQGRSGEATGCNKERSVK